MKKTTTEERTYCDVPGCGKETGGGVCWKCGVDLCSNHMDLFKAEYPKIHTYLCPDDVAEMRSQTNALFAAFRVKMPSR